MDTGFKVVCRFDEAIDALAMGSDDVRIYRDTGDFSKLKFRDGMRPAVFHCRRLKPSEMQACDAYTSHSDRNAAAFARGIIRCESLYSENGGRSDWDRPDPTRPVAPTVVDDRFSHAEVQEVGEAIYGRSLVGKGRPAAWPLPATSRSAVGALVSHLAEQTRKQGATSDQSKSTADPAEPHQAG